MRLFFLKTKSKLCPPNFLSPKISVTHFVSPGGGPLDALLQHDVYVAEMGRLQRLHGAFIGDNNPVTETMIALVLI